LVTRAVEGVRDLLGDDCGELGARLDDVATLRIWVFPPQSKIWPTLATICSAVHPEGRGASKARSALPSASAPARELYTRAFAEDALY
jgi:hypothetical protein